MTAHTRSQDRLKLRRARIGLEKRVFLPCQQVDIPRHDMGSKNWQEIYRDEYDAEELNAEIARLKAQATFYTTQNIGDKGYTKDLAGIEERLHAAIRVRRERRSVDEIGYGVPDFGGLTHG